MKSLVKKKKDPKIFVENVFLHSKPVKMLIALKMNNIRYATQISKLVDCTYSHTVKILDMFKKMGLVSFDKKGRVKFVQLTEVGEEIAHDFEGIVKKLSRVASHLPSEEKPKKK